MSTDPDLAGPWRLAPTVALRPETFGALAYDFTTRRLTFVKDPRLVEVLHSLDRSVDIETAMEQCGIDEGVRPGFRRALSTLAARGTIEPRRVA